MKMAVIERAKDLLWTVERSSSGWIMRETTQTSSGKIKVRGQGQTSTNCAPYQTK
jgi:hypothetical protein